MGVLDRPPPVQVGRAGRPAARWAWQRNQPEVLTCRSHGLALISVIVAAAAAWPVIRGALPAAGAPASGETSIRNGMAIAGLGVLLQLAGWLPSLQPSRSARPRSVWPLAVRPCSGLASYCAARSPGSQSSAPRPSSLATNPRRHDRRIRDLSDVCSDWAGHDRLENRAINESRTED